MKTQEWSIRDAIAYMRGEPSLCEYSYVEMLPSNQRAIHHRGKFTADNVALAVKADLVEVFRGLQRSSAETSHPTYSNSTTGNFIVTTVWWKWVDAFMKAKQ